MSERKKYNKIIGGQIKELSSLFKKLSPSMGALDDLGDLAYILDEALDKLEGIIEEEL